MLCKALLLFPITAACRVDGKEERPIRLSECFSPRKVVQLRFLCSGVGLYSITLQRNDIAKQQSYRTQHSISRDSSKQPYPVHSFMSYRRINIFSRIIRYSSFASLSHSSTLLIGWAVCHAPAPNPPPSLSCSSFYNGLIPIHGIKKYVLFIDFHMTSQLNAHISYLYYITLFAESFGSFSYILRCPPLSPFSLLTPPSNRLDDV